MSDSINSVNNSSVSSTSGTANTSSTQAPADTDTDDNPPDGLILQQGKLFRSLMAGPEDPGRRSEVPVRGGLLPAQQDDADDTGGNSGGLGDGLHRGDVDVAAQLLAQRLLEAGPMLQGTAAASAAPDPTFAELMVRHIRRALVSADAGDDSGGEIHLEMSDSVLPSTVLSLRRTDQGWQLHAVTANPESRQTLTRFAPTLVERFAQSSLGELRISFD